jgi:hypothetical protein
MAQLIHAGHYINEKYLAAAVITVWFLLAVIASLLGVFKSETHPPIMLGLAVVVPVIVYGFCYFAFDLITAVTLGILASGTPVGLLSGEVTVRIMGLFPMSLIPTFFVPLFMIFHLISLTRAGKRLP